MTQSGGFDVEVAISGGGPVGLCLALLLVRRGISVHVVEPAMEIEEDLRASTFHPPTLDFLDRLGVTDTLLTNGLICPHWQIRMHPSGERAVFDLSVLSGDTNHPYRLQCEQWKLSRALADALDKESGAIITRGYKAVEMQEDEDGVTLTIAATEGQDQKTIRCRHLVGADGAHSFVRKAMEMNFEGFTYPETTILATTLFPFEDHLPGLSNVTYCWKPDGNFSLLKVPGRWRISIYPDENLTIEEQLTPEAIEAALQDIVPRDEPYEVKETRPYRVHQRIVDSYTAGRVALAGDAAHLNTPSGGMGLNGGLHDAFGLADALEDILRKGADYQDRFKQYSAVRLPVARDQILAQAHRNRNRMRERDPERRRESLAELIAITSDKAKLYDYLLRSSMITGLRQSGQLPA